MDENAGKRAVSKAQPKEAKKVSLERLANTQISCQDLSCHLPMPSTQKNEIFNSDNLQRINTTKDVYNNGKIDFMRYR